MSRKYPTTIIPPQNRESCGARACLTAPGSGEEVDSQAPTRRAKQVEEGDPTPRGLKIIVIFPAEFEYFMPYAMSYGALARQG